MKITKQNLFGIISGVLAALFLVLSLVFGREDSKTKEIKDMIFYSLKDNSELKSKTIDLIKASKSIIRVFAQNISHALPELEDDLMISLKNKAANGFDVQLITKSTGNFEHFKFYNLTTDSIISDFIIFDDISVILFGLPLPQMSGQIGVEFFKSPSLAHDFVSFFELVKNVCNGKFSKQVAHRWSNQLLVPNNFHNPHLFKNSRNSAKISFTQPVSSEIPPIRDVINETFSLLSQSSTKSINISSASFVQKVGETAFFYVTNQLMKLGLKSTHVRLLISENDTFFEESVRYSLSLFRIPNVEIRVTKTPFFYNFLISDTFSLFTSHPFSDQMFSDSFGLVLVAQDELMKGKLDEIFDDMWNNAWSITENLSVIWNNNDMNRHLIKEANPIDV